MHHANYSLLLKALSACGCVMTMASVQAEVVNWPTYLRSAPDARATVIGELSRGKPVSVAQCGERWCEVVVDGAAGYVERDRIGSIVPSTRFTSNGIAAECFASERAGYKAGQPLLICPRSDAPVKSD